MASRSREAGQEVCYHYLTRALEIVTDWILIATRVRNPHGWMDYGVGQPSAGRVPGKNLVLLDRVFVLSITYRLLRLCFTGFLRVDILLSAHRRRLLEGSSPFLPVYMLLSAHRRPLLEASSALLCVRGLLQAHFLNTSPASSALLCVHSLPQAYFLNTSPASSPLLCVHSLLQAHFLNTPPASPHSSRPSTVL